MTRDYLDTPGCPHARDDYSNLERFQDDETVRAPEPRHARTDGTAPELDTARLAPEVLPETEPEVFYSSLPPEAVNVQSSENFKSAQVNPKKRTKWSVAALTLFFVVVLATGLGIGLWKKKSETLSTPSATVSPNMPPLPPLQQIINDTSLAATVLANGDRHLFFQDPQGVIRRVSRAASATQWILDSVPIPIMDARNFTPIAVTSRKFPYNAQEIELYYISVKNYLNSSTFIDGSWKPISDLSNYSTASNTRQLSITSTNDFRSTSNLSYNQSADLSLLLYENSLGNVSALLEFAWLCTSNCSYLGPDVAITSSYWIDISRNSKEVAGSSFSFNDTSAGLTFLHSGTLYETLPKAQFSPWFASGPTYPINGSDLGVQLLICDGRINDIGLPVRKRDASSCGSIISLNYVPWTNSSHGYFFNWDVAVGATEGIEGTSYNDVNDSDLAMVSPGQFAIWINDTKPAAISYNGIGLVEDYRAVPNASFPLKRLASATSPDQTITYLYHQINGTTFAKEQYITSTNQWIPSAYITIPSS